MKIHFLRFQSWLCLTLLSLLGFSSCRSAKTQPVTTPNDNPKVSPRAESAVMYGVPTVQYHVKGQVLDADGNPVQGIQVLLLDKYIVATADTIVCNNSAAESMIERAAVSTDAQGRYEVNLSTTPSDSQRLLVRDVDGPANGTFQNQLIDIPTPQSDIQGERKGWLLGSVDKKVDVKLMKK